MVRIGYYTLHQRPMPGWQPRRRPPRLTSEPTLSGAVVHARAGATSDEIAILQFGEVMDASPARILLSSYMDVPAALYTLSAAGTVRVAQPVQIIGQEIYMSASHLYVRRNAGAVGHLTVEVWQSGNVWGGLPVAGRGLIGYIGLADLPVAAWVSCDVWAAWALPVSIQPLVDLGYLVLDATSVSGGTVDWGGAAGPSPFAICTQAAGAGWVQQPVGPSLSHGVWQGGPFLVLRGLMMRADAPSYYDFDFEDGQLYHGYIGDITAQNIVVPRLQGGGPTIPPATPGVVSNVELSLLLVTGLT